MANVYATKTGNWSDTTVWNTGALPTSADDVYSNTYTVTIDQNVTVLSLRNGSAASIAAGGGFLMNGAYTANLTAAAGGLIYGSNAAALLVCAPAAGVTQTIQCPLLPSNNVSGLNALTFNGAGTLNYVGTIYNTQNGGQAGNLVITGTGTVNITGSILSNFTIPAVYVGTTATLNVTGTVTGLIRVNSGSPVITITGDLTGATANVNGQGGTAIVTVNGSLTGNSSPCITGTIGSLTTSGPFISSASGILPLAFSGPVRLNPRTNNEFRFLKATGGTSSLYSSDVTSGAPAAADVRNGTTYAGGILTGTLKVPNPAYVSPGVLTDNTVGTFDGGSASAIATQVWAKQTSTLTTAGSVGERVKNASTVDSMGAQIASYTS